MVYNHINQKQIPFGKLKYLAGKHHVSKKGCICNLLDLLWSIATYSSSKNHGAKSRNFPPVALELWKEKFTLSFCRMPNAFTW